MYKIDHMAMINDLWGPIPEPEKMSPKELYNKLAKSERQLLEQKQRKTKKVKLINGWHTLDTSIPGYWRFLDWDGTLTAVFGYAKENMFGNPEKFITRVTALSEEKGKKLRKEHATTFFPHIVASWRIGEFLILVNHAEKKSLIQFHFIQCDGKTTETQTVKVEDWLRWKAVPHQKKIWLTAITSNQLRSTIISKDGQKESASFKTSGSEMSCLDVRSDGETLTAAFARYRDVYCLDLISSDDPPKSFATMDEWVDSVHLFHVREGKRLAVGESSGQVSIFDRTTQQRIAQISSGIKPYVITFGRNLDQESCLYIEGGKIAQPRLWRYEESELSTEKMAMIETGGFPRFVPSSKEFAGQLRLFYDNGNLKLARLYGKYAYILSPEKT